MSAKECTIRLRTPAKVNMFLEVLKGCDNGYHEIRTIMVPVSLYDELELTRTDGLVESVIARKSEKCGEVDVPSEKNLTTRVARALRDATGCKAGARITLWKDIPVGGGLGGGSADAAAALIGLNEIWKTGLSRAELQEIGASIGCDIPPLVHGGPVLAEGFGDKTSPILMDKGPEDWCWLVMVCPGFGVSTKDIYSRLTGALTSVEIPYRNMVSAFKKRDVDAVSAALFNGLQDTVFRKYPLIEMISEDLLDAGAVGSLLSGSGSSIFGLARSREHADRVVAEITRRYASPVWCGIEKTVPDGVMVAHGPLEA